MIKNLLAYYKHILHSHQDKTSNKKGAYSIKPIFSILKDEKSAKYHLKQNDYFGTIATILNLIEDSLKKGENQDLIIKSLNDLQQDLNFIQKNFKIKISPKLNKTKNKEDKNNTKRQTKKPMI